MNFALLAQSPVPEIRDIAPPVEIPLPLWIVVAAVLGALAALGLIAWLLRRWLQRRPPAPPPLPREIALRELAAAREQLDRLDPHAFSILVSDILRAYLTAQYSLPATQQTSPEFLASVKDSPRFTGSEKQLLAAFLEKSDLVKFARVEATREDSAQLLEQAFALVRGGAGK